MKIARLLLIGVPVVLMNTAAAESTSLFDGETLSGWHLASKPEDAGKAGKYWYVEKGAIVCDTAGDRDHDYIWLISDAEYDDFELSLEVKSDSPGNSGIQVRSRYDYETS